MNFKIAIVGGGLSGSLCVMRLFEKFGRNVQVALFEKERGQLHKGVAYSSDLAHQLLNVPAGSMSLFPDRPGHFVDWLHASGYDYQAKDFVPRSIFGRYVSELLSGVKQAFDPGLQLHFDEVTRIVREKGKYKVSCDGGKGYEGFDYVFLCTGNFRPADIPNLCQELLHSEAYVPDPWSGSWIQGVGSTKDVLVIGSGLTMVDQVLSLVKSGHRGKIYILSRRGLLPHTHVLQAAYGLHSPPVFGKGVSDLLRWIKAEIALAQQAGLTWHAVVDAIRPYTPLLWQSWSLQQKQGFLRHLRPYWEIHRHRVPAESLAVIHNGIASGVIRLIAGRIVHTAMSNNRCIATVKLRAHGLEMDVEADRIVNCTGPQSNLRKLNATLYTSLILEGLVEPDPLEMGIATDQDGWLATAGDRVSKTMAVVGPPAKGTHWECTAQREIRLQTQHLADELFARHKDMQTLTV